jgi:hypothetical protein
MHSNINCSADWEGEGALGCRAVLYALLCLLTEERRKHMSEEDSLREEDGICPTCNKRFPKKRFWQRYCNAKCRWKAWDSANPRQRNPKVVRED